MKSKASYADRHPDPTPIHTVTRRQRRLHANRSGDTVARENVERTMRVFLSGPRIMGIRPGVSLSREDWSAFLQGRAAGATFALRASQAFVWAIVIAIGIAAGLVINWAAFG
jgi:hypothetical protein